MRKQKKSEWLPLSPDLVMFNGNVITVDGEFALAEAVAVKGNRIVGVSTTQDMRKLAGEKTELLDLQGAAVLPGINDAHCHMSGFGLERPPFLVDLAYPVIKSMDDMRAATAGKAAEVGP